MRLDLQEFLANAVARWLNRVMLALLPSDRRAWGNALVAEQHEITDVRARLAWAAGGIFMSANELNLTLFTDRPTWIAGLAFGLTSALVDLNSSTRWPYIGLLFTFGLILTSWRPKWAWRWIAVLALSLPAIVLITNNWGPYSLDRFDVFYGLVPATAGSLAGWAVRSASRRLKHRPAGH
jgi:hypothetical protein